MARVNIDILGISELKWTRMGDFNSDGHYIYYCGQEPLRRNEVAPQSTKGSEMQYLGVISLGKPFSIKVIQVYAPTTNADEAEVEQVYEDL